jgi:hypothetical protein
MIMPSATLSEGCGPLVANARARPPNDPPSIV